MSRESRSRQEQREATHAAVTARSILARLRVEQVEQIRRLFASFSRAQVDEFVDVLSRAYGPKAVIIAIRAYGAVLDVLSAGLSFERSPGDVLEPHPLPHGSSGAADLFDGGRR